MRRGLSKSGGTCDAGEDEIGPEQELAELMHSLYVD
jgi:hypothetical protein